MGYRVIIVIYYIVQMKTMKEIAEEKQEIDESLAYDEVISKLQEARDNNVPIEEGLIGSIVGGVSGLTFGPSVMKAICSALGVDPKGTFGSLLTSRLILTAVGAKLGWKM